MIVLNTIYNGFRKLKLYVSVNRQRWRDIFISKDSCSLSDDKEYPSYDSREGRICDNVCGAEK